MHTQTTFASARRDSRSRLRAMLVLATCAAASAAVYFISPQETPWLPHCVFWSITGLYCPGCGVLRCLHSLSHGRIVAALAFNPLAVIAVPVLLYSLVRQIISDLSGRILLAPVRLSAGAARLILAVLVAFAIARNIPLYPFVLLAPH